MKIYMLLLSTIIMSQAHAGVSLRIEHPRNPSRVKDHYNVKCNSSCSLEMRSPQVTKGTSSSKVFSKRISDLIQMKAKGDLPKSHEDARLVMYKIEATDGKQSINLVLGYPLSYVGEEYSKYANVISIIEEIKRNMHLELTEKK